LNLLFAIIDSVFILHDVNGK